MFLDDASDERGVGDVAHFERRVDDRAPMAVLERVEHHHVDARSRNARTVCEPM